MHKLGNITILNFSLLWFTVMQRKTAIHYKLQFVFWLFSILLTVPVASFWIFLEWFFYFLESVFFKQLDPSSFLINAKAAFPWPSLSDSKSKHHYLCRNLHLISSLVSLIPPIQTQWPKLPDRWIKEKNLKCDITKQTKKNGKSDWAIFFKLWFQIYIFFFFS